MTDLTVANTILAQLGGPAFLRMTGATDLLGDTDSLVMGLPATLTKGRINKLRVRLDPSDTYVVTTYKYSHRTLTCPVVEERRDIYAEDLRDAFTAMTGLDTRMPKISFRKEVA